MRQARLISWIMVTLASQVAASYHCRAGSVDADPNQLYEVTPEAGPWMICVTSSGAASPWHCASTTGPQARVHGA